MVHVPQKQKKMEMFTMLAIDFLQALCLTEKVEEYQITNLKHF